MSGALIRRGEVAERGDAAIEVGEERGDDFGDDGGCAPWDILGDVDFRGECFLELLGERDAREGREVRNLWRPRFCLPKTSSSDALFNGELPSLDPLLDDRDLGDI